MSTGEAMIIEARNKARLAGLGFLCALAFHLGLAQAAEQKPRLDKINHILVVYLENRSFDNLYGLFPRANGLANAGAAATQVDKDGNPYATMPPVMNASKSPPEPDSRFPANLPNAPFQIDKYVPIDQTTGDLVHRYYQEQAQIDGGKMDKFVAYSDAATLSLGYYDIRKTALWGYARRYTLADNFFHAAFGGSSLNHFWLVCECAPRFPNAPAAITAQLDPAGNLIKDGVVSPDGYVINTVFTANNPHPASAKPENLLPSIEGMITIGDQLSGKGVSWAWYSGGWNDALAGHPDSRFQFHHQILAFFKQFADGTAAKKEHLRDEADLVADIKHGKLPAFAIWKPIGAENQHPGYAELVLGDHRVDEMIKAVRKSRLWKDTVIIVTYDEHGGYWDHVAPPKFDKWGPGARVPALIVSPLAKRGYIDHTLYDTTSILKLVHERYGLPPLSDRESRVGDLTNALKL
jgi:phospholipase C